MVIVATVLGVILGLVIVILVGFLVHRYRSKAKIMRRRARDSIRSTNALVRSEKPDSIAIGNRTFSDSGMADNAYIAEPTRRVAAPLRDDINMDVVEKVLQTSI